MPWDVDFMKLLIFRHCTKWRHLRNIIKNGRMKRSKNPCLWDIFDKSYQKRDEREKALAAIAEQLDVQIADI